MEGERPTRTMILDMDTNTKETNKLVGTCSIKQKSYNISREAYSSIKPPQVIHSHPGVMQ